MWDKAALLEPHSCYMLYCSALFPWPASMAQWANALGAAVQWAWLAG